jgi:Malectin domain
VCFQKISEWKMRSAILVLFMASHVIAFEQIYAVNAGGNAHTDSDGIVYQRQAAPIEGFSSNSLKLGNVPEADRIIYAKTDQNFFKTKTPLHFDIPLKNDGLYLLIAKFTSCYSQINAQNMILNNEIHLHPNMSVYNLCGGQHKICDEHFYFCVSDNTLYHKDQSTLIRNGEIHIQIHTVEKLAFIAGLVLLKGTLGEKHKLISSATNEPIFFDPAKTHYKCGTTAIMLNQFKKIQEEQRRSTEKLQNRMETLSEQNFLNHSNSCAAAFTNLQAQQINNFTQIQKNLEHFDETNFQKISNLNSTIQSSIQSVQKANTDTQVVILREVTNLNNQQKENFKRLETVEHRINKNFESLSEKSLKNISNLGAVVKTSLADARKENVNDQRAILREIQSLQNETSNRFTISDQKIGIIVDRLIGDNANNISNMNAAFNDVRTECKNTKSTLASLQRQQTEVKSSIEAINQTSIQILTQQIRIQNQASEQINTKFEKFQFELTSQATKIEKANNKIEMLQADVRQLVETQQQSDKIILAKQASLESQISAMSKDISDIRDAVLTIVESTKLR